MNDYEESTGIQEDSDSNLQSMSDDDLRSVSGFEAADSDDTHENEVSHSAHTSQDGIASVERLSLPDHMDHICEEVGSLHSRLGDMESSIVQKVFDEIKSSLPALVTNALKEQLPGILLATLKDSENITPPKPTPETQGEIAYKESTLPVSETKVNEESSMVLYDSEKKDLVDLTTTEQDSEDDDDLDKQPLFKRFKIMHPIPNKPQPSVKQFTSQLFGTTSLKFSPTPPRDEFKEKGIATKEPPKDIMPFMEEGGSVPKIPNLKLADLKEQEKKSNEELKKLLNPATFKAQALKWEEHEEKKAKMLKEFNKCISERTNPLPITKISYVVNSSKTATMRITRDKDPLNLRVYPDFRLRMLGFNEWLEAKRLGLPPPPELATFGLTTEEKKKEKDIVPQRWLVIKESESGIFFINKNMDIAFQRESEFHLTPTVQLIRTQNQIKVDLEIANEMFRTMNYVIEARDDCIKARETVMKGLFECKASESNVNRIQVKDIVKEAKDHLKKYSSVGMDISWHLLLCRTYTVDL
ncbi:hypothetical protein Tco_1220586 [Tanacetum coccineum]